MNILESNSCDDLVIEKLKCVNYVWKCMKKKSLTKIKMWLHQKIKRKNACYKKNDGNRVRYVPTIVKSQKFNINGIIKVHRVSSSTNKILSLK